MLCAVPAPAQSAKNPELQKIADAFVAAWSKGDAKALTALFAENGINADSFGQTTAGRAAIEEGFTKGFAGPLKGSKLVVTPVQERDHSRVDGHERHVGNLGRYATAGSGQHGHLHQHDGQAGRQVADRQFSAHSRAAEAVA